MRDQGQRTEINELIKNGVAPIEEAEGKFDPKGGRL